MSERKDEAPRGFEVHSEVSGGYIRARVEENKKGFRVRFSKVEVNGTGEELERDEFKPEELSQLSHAVDTTQQELAMRYEQGQEKTEERSHGHSL